MMDFAKLTNVMRELALWAGDEIMEIYGLDDFEVRSKSDESPVTIADEAADACQENAFSHNDALSNFRDGLSWIRCDSEGGGTL